MEHRKTQDSELTKMFSKRIKYISFIISVFLSVSCKQEIKQETPSESNPTEQVSELNQKIKENPDNADLYHQRAKYYFENKDFDAAFADLGRVLKTDSSKAVYYLTLSDIYFVTNKTSKSKSALEKAITLDPKNTDALMKLAELYLYVQKHQESIDYINKVLALDQYNAKAYFMKGMNYKELGDTAKAISSMQTSVEQDAEYYAAYMQLGILFAAKKDPLAIDYYNNALKINSGSIEAYYGKGKFYQDMGDSKRAIAIYQELLHLDPNYKFTHFNLGVIYLVQLKQYDLAIKNFDNAIISDPQYAEAYYAKGVCYQALGDEKKATENFNITKKINPH